MILALSLVLAGLGCLGLILAGKGKWYGWALGLAIQPVWAIFGILTGGYGLCISAAMYASVYTHNLWQFRKSKTQVADHRVLQGLEWWWLWMRMCFQHPRAYKFLWHMAHYSFVHRKCDVSDFHHALGCEITPEREL